MKQTFQVNKRVLVFGVFLCVSGVVLNEWTLAYFLSDGQIESLWRRVVIWVFDIVLLLCGYMVIKRVKKVSYKNILLLIFSTFLAFLIAELLFRLFYPIVSPVDQLFGKSELFEPKPYVMFGGKPNYEGLNSLGYVEAAPSLNKQPNEYRIFLLGGSAVFNGKPTISALLENTFHNNGFPNVKCYNFGVPASTSGMELARILYEIYDYEPGMIIMYNGGNDLMINHWADPRPGYPYNYFIYENNPLLEKDVGKYPMVNLILYESKLLRHLFPGYFIKVFTNHYQIREDVKYGNETWENEIVKSYTSNIVKAQKVTNAFGADFMVFFQPLVYFKDILHQNEEQFISTNYISTMHSKFIEGMNSISDSTGINFIDLSNMFDGIDKQVFVDEIHTLQESKTIISQELFKQLLNTFDSSQFKDTKNYRLEITKVSDTINLTGK